MNRIMITAAVAVTVAAVHAENTWYLLSSGSGKHNQQCYAKLEYWSLTPDGTAGSGTPTSSDNLIVNSSRRLRCGNVDFTTTCKSLTIGDDSTSGDLIHDRGVATYANDGIFLKNGRYEFNTAIDLYTAGKMTVLSGAAQPCIIHSQQWQYSRRTHTIGGKFIGATGTGVLVGGAYPQPSEATPAPTNTTIIITDPSQYYGSFQIVAAFSLDRTTGQFGTRLKLGTITTPGDIAMLSSGCILAARTASDVVTCSSLTIPTGNRIEVQCNGSSVGRIKTTGTASVAAGTEVELFGTPSAGSYAILESDPSSTFTAEDFTLVGDVANYAEASLSVESDSNSRRLMLTLKYDYVLQTVDDGRGKDAGSYINSSFTNAAHWSDGKLPHSGAVYVTKASAGLKTIQDRKVYEFPGEKLIMQDDSRILFYGAGFKVKKLIVPSGVKAEYWSGQTSYHDRDPLTADSIVVDGVFTLASYNTTSIVIDGPVTGSGELRMWGVDSTGAYKGSYFASTNALGAFDGRLTVSVRPALQGNGRDQTYYVRQSSDFGAALDAFDYRGITVEDGAKICSMRDVSDESFVGETPLNRGIYIRDLGILDVQKALGEMTLNSSVTLDGKMLKDASGRLALSAPMKFISKGTLTDTPTVGSNIVQLVGGRIQARHSDALNGAEIHLDASATQNGWLGLELKLDYSDADMMRYGLRNTKTDTPFVIDSGCALTKFPVEVFWPESPANATGFRQGLLTVSAAAETSALAVMPNLIPAKRIHRGFGQSLYRQVNDDGTITYGVEFTPKGFVIEVR